MVKKSKAIKNPLSHRYLRELRSDFGKYLVIFLLMAMSIAEVSGFLVADESMIKSYNESFEKYNVEDGHFEVEEALTPRQKTRIEELGISLYENEYVDFGVTVGNAENEGANHSDSEETFDSTETSNSAGAIDSTETSESTKTSGSSEVSDNTETSDSAETLRIYKMRTEVDLADLMEGAFPENEGEIAIDRMYADNNGLDIGDVIARSGSSKTWTVTGLIALSDYSALFEDNNDSMFDALEFGVAVVTEAEFETFSQSIIHYNYSWLYDDKPSDTAEEKDRSEDLMKAINAIVPLEEFVPRYANQSITFTGEDMGSDRQMMIVLLYMIIAILAFVFAVTITNTIKKEANVIGTLRASGYTRGELVRHYMVMPLIVTLISAVVGNILGYTALLSFNIGMYYDSYSLPTYTMLWSADAFFETTLIPIVMMVVITYFILSRALKVPPLNFLRGEVRRRGRTKAMRLSHRLPIFDRFRLRVLFQNIPNYVILFLGILFADVLLMFGLALPKTIAHYQVTISENLISKYQYLLTVPASMERDEENSTDILGMLVDAVSYSYGVRTENKDAEEFSAGTLKTTGEGGRIVEDVTLYGMKDRSNYVHLEMKSGDVYISSAFADKYSLKNGSALTLKEEYGDETYDFTVTGIYDYEGGLCIFMPMDDLNDLLGYDDGFFAGYFSNTEITDIKQEYIGTVIDFDSITKISRQLDVSMGGLMDMVCGFAVVMFLILVYLLTKTIIEKNAESISMSKILGYKSGEIGRIYLLPTTFAVAVLLIAAIPVVQIALIAIYREYMLTMMPGYMPVFIDTELYLQMFFLGFGAYLVVMVLEMRKIKKLPMDIALKTME